jgi:hypothetical protein
MNSQENLRLTGKLNIVVTDQHGVVKDERNVDNLVVTSGLTYIASRMAAATAGVASHMAVGTSSTATAAGQVNLQAAESARVALTSTTPGSTGIVYVASFPAGTATAALQEAAIFNYGTFAAVPGANQHMLCRTVFSVINKAANDTMTITWTINLVAV